MYAVVDCNNFFVSCERVFRPDLEGKPVMVLSNNDGCVVSRSQEVKALGIPMGAPVFKYRDLIKQHQIAVFSANFSLYSDLSIRVMRTLSQFVEHLEVYSIDEAFMGINSSKLKVKNDGEVINNTEIFGRKVKQTVKRWTGVPVSVGIGETKTLAKAASELAKKWEYFDGVLDLSHHERQAELLTLLPAGDVWGIGRRFGDRLRDLGVVTAFQLQKMEETEVWKRLGIMGLRTVWELSGRACIGLSEGPRQQKSIISSRSFGRPVESFRELREAVALFISRAAEKLRDQGLAAREVYVWINTSRFKEHFYVNSGMYTLEGATDYTPELIQAAVSVLEKIFRPGCLYKKAGVILGHLTPVAYAQQRLFGVPAELESRQRRLMQAMDRINEREGRSAIAYAATGIQRKWKSKRELCSPRYTTDWKELREVTSVRQ